MTATAKSPTPALQPVQLGWWDIRVLGYHALQPKELIAHAALHFYADVMLQDRAALDRVAEHYIAASCKAGYWLHTPNENRITDRSQVRGYRARLKEYRDTQAWFLRHRAPAVRKAA